MEIKIRILIFEREQADLQTVNAYIAAQAGNFDVKKTSDPVGFEGLLTSFNPEIVICDFDITAITIPRACELSRVKAPNALLILRIEQSNEKQAIEMMEKEIDDYIFKEKGITIPIIIRKAIESRKGEKMRELALEKLQLQEQKFKAILEHSYESVSLFDKDLNIIYRSASISRILGFSMQDLEKITLFDLVHPDDENKLQALFLSSLNQEKIPIRGFFRVKHHSGNFIDIEATVTNMLNDPNVKAYICNYRDVSETKRYEEQLLQSGNYFKALLENISDAIILIDRFGIINYVSPSVQRTTGYTPEDMLRKDLTEFLHPQDVEIARRFVQKIILNPGPPMQNSYRLKNKKGGYIWVGSTLTNMLADPSVNGLIINYHDITRRRLSQQLLRKSEANLKTVFENTKISYVLIDRHYHVISYNHLAKTWYKPTIGIDLKEGINILEAAPPERREKSKKDFDRIFSGEKISYEQKFVATEGQILWYQVDLLPVHDNYNAVLGLLISSEDITARKNAEIESEKLTADIIQHNKNLEQFAYIISHNLRSPVANIMGLAALINTAPDMNAFDFNKCVEGLLTTAQKLDAVINDLNYILQTRREIKESLENVSFSAIMKEVSELLEESLEKEDILVQTDFKADKIYTVRSYLHSIFLNLITNSIKYRNPKVPPVIEVSTRLRENQVHISFRDNGLGIDLNVHGDKIFGLYKKFHQHIDGKGMGLYMVKTQVEMLGGTISIKSDINKGTQFDINFPVNEMHVAVSAN